VLRLLQSEDVPAFAAYRSDAEVARYQSWEPTYSLADGERLVASQQGVDFGDPGPWVQVAAIDRVSGALCGDCAVRVAPDQPRTAEVGVTLAPAQPLRRDWRAAP
jgi:RimJ/RimL family protein N-acetyltransferase